MAQHKVAPGAPVKIAEAPEDKPKTFKVSVSKGSGRITMGRVERGADAAIWSYDGPASDFGEQTWQLLAGEELRVIAHEGDGVELKVVRA